MTKRLDCWKSGDVAQTFEFQDYNVLLSKGPLQLYQASVCVYLDTYGSN